MRYCVVRYVKFLFRWTFSWINYIFLLIKVRILSVKPFNSKIVGIENSNVIVSLTSYHSRFPKLKLTLESLFRQITESNYSVLLILSEEDIKEYGGLPDGIDNFIKKGLVLKIVSENIKSFKKAFYSYDYNIPIVTADDDIYYPSYWLQFLLSEAEKQPNTVLAYRGHYALSDGQVFHPYIRWMNWSNYNYINKPSYNFMPTGTSGVYYPVGSLKGLKESLDLFLSLCPHADDFWLKYLTVKNGYMAKRISLKNIHFQTTNICEEDSLSSINVILGKNDVQFNNILQYDSSFNNLFLDESINVK